MSIVDDARHIECFEDSLLVRVWAHFKSGDGDCFPC